jgi:hypothetical protein
MIKNWKQFYESYKDEDQTQDQTQDQVDMDNVLNWVASNIPSDEIPFLINDLETPVKESLNENFITDIKNKLIKWFDKKIFDYIVNKKKDFYTELIGKLQIFDLTSLDDIEENFRNFKLHSIYLAGGMDKAKDVGAGWRAQVEYEFEVVNGGKKSKMDEVVIPYMGQDVTVTPAYIVDNENLDRFIKEGGNKFVLKNYDTPALLNPVRKEVDRTKNPKFAEEMGKFKSGEYEETEDPRTFDEINKIFSKTIEPEDELIVNACDAFFVGFNESTSGGSFGELQQASFLNKPIFAWYIDDWKISGHSPWNLPHVSKIMRTTEDMKTFVKTMINYKK